MALRDKVKGSRKAGGSLRSAVKGRTVPASKTPTPKAPPPEQAAQAVRPPIPAMPEPFEYVRYVARIPGLRKMTQT